MLQAWSGWPPARRKLVAVAAAGVAVALGVWSWATRPPFVPLYSRLEVQEAARVVEALQQLGIPYRLTGAGTTVEVPRDRVYAARLQLASARARCGQSGTWWPTAWRAFRPSG
jgi:flagellar M-ring protein FliF